MTSINTISNSAEHETIALYALQMAQEQLGQSEKPIGSNSGPMVNEYLKSVGLAPGYAWCQAFVYWCYAQAALKQKAANTVIKTGSVMDCWNKTTGIKKITKAEAHINPEIVKPGYQFILSFGINTGHTGIVESIDMSTNVITIHTIEGNSNTDGSREGYEVVRHKRTLGDKSLLGFICY